MIEWAYLALGSVEQGRRRGCRQSGKVSDGGVGGRGDPGDGEDPGDPEGEVGAGDDPRGEGQAGERRAGSGGHFRDVHET